MGIPTARPMINPILKKRLKKNKKLGKKKIENWKLKKIEKIWIFFFFFFFGLPFAFPQFDPSEAERETEIEFWLVTVCAFNLSQLFLS